MSLGLRAGARVLDLGAKAAAALHAKQKADAI